MQINLSRISLKESFKYLGWVLLFVSLWFRGCSGGESSSIPDSGATVKVTTPKIEGSFKTVNPVNTPLIKANSPQLKKSKPIYIENPVDEKLIAENEKLKNDFAKETDSLKRVIAYNKAVKLNSFSTKFDDANLSLTIDGIVQGEVKEITPHYTIKERKTDVFIKPKVTVFRLLGGFEIGNTAQLDNFRVKGNLMFQNKKGHVFSGSFDTSQTVWIGYNSSIFSIKR